MKLPSEKLNVKIIALDLDDTLLNGQLTITPKTVSALKNAAAQGIWIVLCSGRTENAILPFVRKLDIAGTEQGRYLIALNGAEIFDLHKRQSIYSQKLDKGILSYVYEEALKRSLPAQVYDPSTIYASVDNEWTQKDAFLCKLKLQIRSDFCYFIEKGFSKMVIPASPEKISSFQAFLQEKLKGKADVFISKPYFLEIMPYGCGKGSAVLKLAEHLGIPQSQTMAFGDSMNDESMILQTKYGVAMCNGLEHIKKIAEFITEKSNEEDGIALFLEKFVI